MHNSLSINTDQHPYGMVMPNRHGNAHYRYGFQGQEKDDEVKGQGNSVNYKFRMHDPRVGRFFAVDPLAPKYPWYTPYQFSGNKVIACRELEGLEEIGATKKDNQGNDTGEPVHQQGYNINIGGESGINVPVYQRGEGGALAISKDGLRALGEAGYKIEPERSGNPYQSTQISTDPTQPMILSVGGTTVTSSHSSGNYDSENTNKFPIFVITPPTNITTTTVSTTITTSGTSPIFASGVGLGGADGGVITPTEAVPVIAASIAPAINALPTSAPAGTIRVPNSATVFVNSTTFNAAQIAAMNTALNPPTATYRTIVIGAILPSDTSFRGGIINYTDSRTISTPIMAPTALNVTITDLVN